MKSAYEVHTCSVDQLSQSYETCQSESLAIQETLKKLEEFKSEKTDDISIMEGKLATLEKQYQTEKEVSYITRS